MSVSMPVWVPYSAIVPEAAATYGIDTTVSGSGSRSERWRVASGQFAVGLVITLVVPGCTDADAGHSSSSSSSTTTVSSSVEFVARMDALMAAVNKVQDSSAVVSVPARPTVVQHQRGVQTMIIRDEDAGAWAPGRYRLVVRCAGEGVLVAHFSLGERSVIRQLMDCAAATRTDALEIELDRVARNSVVVVVPAGESMAAVGYQIQKVA